MEIVVILVLFLLNGVFSMSEIALVSARKFKLEAAAKKGKKSAKRALELSKNPTSFLSAIQIGITLIGILAGVLGGDSLSADLETVLRPIPYIGKYAEPISFTIVIMVMTFFSITLGELLPKRIGMMFPEKIALMVAQPMTIISIVTKPFIWLLTKTNDSLLRLLQLNNTKEGVVSEEEIKAMVLEGTVSGEVQQIEHNIVNRVFALGDRRVSELMTHRSDLIWLDITDTWSQIRQKVKSEVHSTYPVCFKSLDNVIGMVSIKELFSQDFTQKNFQLKKYVRKPLVVHENFMAYQVLEKFKKEHVHNAFVVDEYGVLQGMVTMDDMLDALVGDVTEYNQQDDYSITERSENSWLADGQLPFFEFLHYFDIPDDFSEGEYNTIAGFMIDQLERMPETGDKIEWEQFILEVIDMDGNRIDKILINLKD